MRISETIRSLRRRWYVLVAGALLTAGLGWGVFNYIPVKYETAGSQLLMPPAATVGEDGNPYLFLGGMNEALDVLIRRSNSAESSDPILNQFPDAEYTVSRDYQTPSPILIIEVSAPSEKEAIQLLTAAMSTVSQNLVAMQEEDDVPQSMVISTRDLEVPEDATVNSKMAMQTTVLAVGVGLVGTIMLTGFLDGALLRRTPGPSSRRAKGRGNETDGGQPTEHSPQPDSRAAKASPIEHATSVPTEHQAASSKDSAPETPLHLVFPSR